MRSPFPKRAQFIGCATLSLILCLSARSKADAPKPADQAAQLVHSALQAEATGKPDQRADLLKQALATAPDFAPAHWQLGEIHTDGGWTSIDDTAKQDAHSAKLDEYRKLRDQASQTVDAQLDLARWCEKNVLKEQQRAHLMFALELQPNCKEAISKLGLVRYRGELVPATELDDIKARLKQSIAESKEWKERVESWRQQLQDHPNAAHDDVLKQIRAIRDPAAIPVLERELAHSGQEVCLAVIDALTAMPQQAATESLLRAALFSPYDKVIYEATYALKSRSPYSYVPLLLASMKAPISVEYGISRFDGHHFSDHVTLFQQGAAENEVYFGQSNFSQPRSRYGPDVATSSIASVATQQELQAVSIARNVESANQDAAAFNGVLASVLETTTGQQLGIDAVSWWNWWYDENDYYSPPEKPDNVTSSTQTVYIPRVSCFVAGTPVWTTTGPMQIEKVKVGELVLAQDPETGELAYKPVLGTTIRPASPIVETHLGDRMIRSTRGHPFWVSGKGWQMAKELKAGEWLHTVHGPVQIDAAEPSDEAVCYNLVVADFHDYFVGDAKVLVHDNLLRGPTLVTVPGLAEAK
jgi:hypothetical protein